MSTTEGTTMTMNEVTTQDLIADIQRATEMDAHTRAVIVEYTRRCCVGSWKDFNTTLWHKVQADLDPVDGRMLDDGWTVWSEAGRRLYVGTWSSCNAYVRNHDLSPLLVQRTIHS